MSYADLTGKRFGYLTVIKEGKPRKHYKYVDKKKYSSYTRRWVCQCDCGETINVDEYGLTKRGTKQCSPKRHDTLIGQKFSSLTVIKRVENYISPKGFIFAQWLCKCDCGNEIKVLTGQLTSGNTKSCGCKKRERMKEKAGTYRNYEQQLSNVQKTHKTTIKDGVNVGIINGRLSVRNTSGYKGIRWYKGSWQATIGYKRRNIYLLRSQDITDCIKIREMAVDAVNEGAFDEFYSKLKGK